MSSSEWQSPKRKRDNRQYVRYNDALATGKELDITGFADAMVSAESRQLQDQGYVFRRVRRGDEASTAD